MLSESVGNALSMGPDKDEVCETARFVKMFDKYVNWFCMYYREIIHDICRFFDCLNVTSLNAGVTKRKEFQKPYFSPTDPRLSVSYIVFVVINNMVY